MIPLSLYIHIPWCVRKCPYCDFNSHQLQSNIPEFDYLNALLEDLQQHLAFLQDRPIHSIFIGGGTPSLMSCEFYQQLLPKLKDYLQIPANIEITLEANPGTFEQQRFAGFKDAGINRLSIGVQSFQDEKLQKLGRIHSAKEAQYAITAAQEVGFSNINIDLMHGLENQSTADALEDLNLAISLKPTHISWYQLTLEPNTLFAKFPPILPTDDQIWEMQEQGKKLMQQEGYLHYEISAYSKLGQESQHNLNYWQFGDYLGIGAGAHSKLTHLKNKKITRYWNVKSPKTYLDTKKTFGRNQNLIADKDIAFEFMLNALRLMKPIKIQLFESRTGLKFNFIEPQLKIAKQNYFLTYDKYKIELTGLGRKFLNDVLEIFL